VSSLTDLLKKYQDVISLGSIDRPKTMFSLGPLSLNLAVGNPNGVQSGRIIQIAGKYSSGKTTLAQDIVAQHQKATGLPVAYIDFERAFDKDYAQKIGVNTDKLHIVRADTTEQGLDICEALIKSGDIRLVVIDSVAAAKPSSEDDKSYEDSPKVGGNSIIISRFCNRIVPLIDNNDVLIVLLNQLRANMNTMSPEREIPYGAKSLHFATSVLIRTTNIKTTAEVTDIQAVVHKNKVGAPRHVAQFSIRFDRGIDHAQDIVQLAIERDLVHKSGSWLTYGSKKVQGIERAGAEFPVDEIRARIIEGIK